jgi:hypothetical protein
MKTLLRLSTPYLLTFCCAFGAPALFAETYYVDPENGSSANAGSEAEPWRTLQAILLTDKVFEEGDIILLKDGYHGFPVIQARHGSGVVVRPVEGAEPYVRNLQFTGAQSWTVEGLAISPEHSGVYTASRPLVEIDAESDGVVLADCDIFGADTVQGWTSDQVKQRFGTGILCYGTNTTLRGNQIRNTKYAIEVMSSATGMVCENNVASGIMGDGIRFLASSGRYEGNMIRDFYGIDNHHDDGLQCWTNGPGGVGSGVVRNIVIRGNTIINQTDPNNPFPDTYGVQGMGFFDGFYENWVIENNIVATDMWHGITLLGAKNCHVVNNTVVEGPLGSLTMRPWIQIASHKDGRKSEKNVVSNNFATSYDNAPDIGVVENNFQTRDYEAHFVDYANFDFHLQPTSGAVNYGTSGLAPEVDFEGDVRDALPDAGADEIAADETDPIVSQFPRAARVEEDVYRVSWMGEGDFNTSTYPWILHELHGWWWIGAAREGSYWFYDLNLAWVFTNPQYPHLYYFMSEGSWFYFLPYTGMVGSGRWFYDYAKGEWRLS